MKILATNPDNAARELHKALGWTKPDDFTLEEVAFSIGASVKETVIEGSAGRILINGDNAIISVNSTISNSARKNFVVAHEIGHFVLHKKLNPIFHDTDETLSEWYKNGIHEQEANKFASEFLMPTEIFSQKVKGKRLDLALIESVASYFKVSLTATFLKYITAGDFPLMVVFVDNGLVKWKKCSTDFPFQYITNGSKVSSCTIAGDFFNGNNLEEKPEKVPAIEWFPEDREIRFKKDWLLWEQCFQVSNTGIISCIWTF